MVAVAVACTATARGEVIAALARGPGELRIRTTARWDGNTTLAARLTGAVVVAGVLAVAAPPRLPLAVRVARADRTPSAEQLPLMRVVAVVAVDPVVTHFLQAQAVRVVRAAAVPEERQLQLRHSASLPMESAARTVWAVVEAAGDTAIPVLPQLAKARVAVVVRALSSCAMRCRRCRRQIWPPLPTTVRQTPTTSLRSPR